MPNRTRRTAESRAEARRRSRQLARGYGPEQDESDGDAADEEQRGPTSRPTGGFLGRLFPPAPPLPNRPDPLAGFEYQGPFRSVVAAGYLIARNPRSWLLPGMTWAAAQTVSYLALLLRDIFAAKYAVIPPNYSLVEIVSLLGSVFAVIAAGWMGWQRPWLFGLAAVMAGTFLQALVLALLTGPASGAGAATVNPLQIFVGVTLTQILQLQWILGALMGWYGGYLRRRMAVGQPPPPRRARR